MAGRRGSVVGGGGPVRGSRRGDAARPGDAFGDGAAARRRARKVVLAGVEVDKGSTSASGAYTQTLALLAALGVPSAKRSSACRCGSTTRAKPGSASAAADLARLPCRRAASATLAAGAKRALLQAAARWWAAGFRCPEGSRRRLDSDLPGGARRPARPRSASRRLNTPAGNTRRHAFFLRVLGDALYCRARAVPPICCCRAWVSARCCRDGAPRGCRRQGRR
jgi:hypothetical protein